MDTVGSIIEEKGGDVFTVPPSASVTQAVQTMSRRRVGAVLVCSEGRCVGIFTERDVMNRVVLTGIDPGGTTVADVMTPEVACVEPGTTAVEAMAIMTERHCRHLPVIRGGEIVGMISIGDLVRRESRNQQFEIRMLTDFILGKYPG